MNREHDVTGETTFKSKPASKPKPGKIQRASDPLFQIQQTIGNQAMMQMLRAKSIQAKLTVGQPGDTYEQEADRVADQVMRMPDPSVQRKSPEEDETLQTSPLDGSAARLIQRQLPEEEEKLQTSPLTHTLTSQIQRQSPEEDEKLQTSPLTGTITPLIQRQSPEEDETLQAKSADSGMESTVDASLEGNINNLRGGGQPLPQSVRNYFEPRFGYDFSQVRVHNDSRAADSAQAVNAKAFTLGQDVVFNTGQYAPEHEEGKKLIAHELTHVVQQNGR